MKVRKIVVPLAFVAALICSITIQAQTPAKKITVSIAGVEYDNPHLITLRESLKKNPKVKSMQPSFASGTATLSFNYSGDAPQLWDELSKTARQPFKVSEIMDNSISLNYTGTTTPSATPGNTAPTAAKKENCKECEYFPLCNSDGTKSFQGKVFKKIDYDEGPIYYNCDNGIVTKKWENISEDGDGYRQHNGYLTLVILKTNVPVGTKWSHEFVTTGGLLPTNSTYSFEILEKNKPYDVEGTRYENVIVVKEIDGVQSRLCYYAKGHGLVATKDLGMNEFLESMGFGDKSGDMLTKYAWQHTTIGDAGSAKGKKIIVEWTFKADNSYVTKANFKQQRNGDYLVLDKLEPVSTGGIFFNYWRRTKRSGKEFIETSSDRLSWVPVFEIHGEEIIHVEENLVFKRVPLSQ